MPSVSDVTAESRDTIEGLCSALCETNQAMDELQTVVDGLQRTMSEEIAHLSKALQRAKQKPRDFRNFTANRC